MSDVSVHSIRTAEDYWNQRAREGTCDTRIASDVRTNVHGLSNVVRQKSFTLTDVYPKVPNAIDGDE